METPFNKPKQPNKKVDVRALGVLGVLLVTIMLVIGLVLQSRSLSPQKQAATTSDAVCVPEFATCKWESGAVAVADVDAPDGAYGVEKFTDSDGVEKYRFLNVTYKYSIFDVTDNAEQTSGSTTETSVTFVPKLGHQYRCEVIATNKCGDGGKTTATGTCGLEIPTPTPPPATPTPPPATPTPTIPPSCGETCGANASCPTGLTCSNEVCVLDACADGSSECSENKCQVLDPTPTLTPVPTNTPTPEPTLTPTPNPVCGGSCTTQSQCPSDNSCVNGTCQLTRCTEGEACTDNNCQVTNPTSTPVPVVPTTVVIVNNEQSQQQSQQQTVVVTTAPEQAQQPTVVPTIPAAGTPAGVYFMVASSVVLASLLLIF